MSSPRPSTTSRSRVRLFASTRSSASSHITHGPVAWRRLSLRAALKLSGQAISKTRARQSRASSLFCESFVDGRPPVGATI